MQNGLYIIQKFSEKFQKITTIKELIELSRAQKLDIEIDFVHRIPRVFTWRPADDSFSEEYNLLVYPRISIEGKTFAPLKMVDSQAALGIMDCERVFLEVLKHAVSSAEQVW